MGAAERIYREDGFQNKNGATRNVRRQMRPTLRVVETTTPTVTQAGSAPSTDEQFTAQYAKAGVGKAANDESYKAPRQPAARDAGAVYEPAVRRKSLLRRLTKKKEKSEPATATTFARVRALSANIGIWSWGTFTWLFIQLPFAFASLIFLGMAAAIDSFFKTNTTGNIEDGFFTKVGKIVIDFASTVAAEAIEALDTISNFLFGFDLSALNPTNLFLATYLIVLGYAITILFAILLIYTFRRLHPLSGDGASMKVGLFLLAIAGYSVPILNLFPWFLPWTFAVLWKPK